MWSPSRVRPWLDGHHVRPEIQALRAVAVTLVVIYHAEPRVLPGGYVGVDVFFVISGFLITTHIARGIAADTPFSLAGFYVKRIRRLLPASMVVLFVVALVTLTCLPQTMWNRLGKELVASAFYVQNWTLASSSVDYLAAAGSASPLQHFWSLSAEEQFYLVWPLLLVVAAAAGSRFTDKRTALIAAVTATTLLSFAYSVHETHVSPTWAYFVTPTRAWELGIGGLVALTVPVLSAPSWLRSALSWAGLATIFGSAVFLSGATEFPGSIALIPVLGAMAVIVAGNVPGRLAPTRLANLRAVQFVGDISYSVYLWHWPLIVLVPLVLHGPGYHLSLPAKVLVAASAIPVAWVSKKFVEDPFREGLARRRARTVASPGNLTRVLAGAVAGMLVIGGLGGVVYGVSQARIGHAEAALRVFDAADHTCVGAASLQSACAGRSPDGVQPAPVIAARNAEEQGCQQLADRATVIRCEYGSADPAATQVAVVGDSHANQWMPAIRAVADRLGWHLVTYFKSGCAYAVGLGTDSCQAFDAEVATRLQSDGLDMVITSARAGVGYGVSVEDAADRFAAAWQPLIASGVTVHAIADIPEPANAGIFDPPSCLESGRSCTIRPADVAKDDALVLAAKQTGASLADLRDYFCFHGDCPLVIGGVLVYRDSNHMTAVYARSLSPILEQRLLGAPAGDG